MDSVYPTHTCFDDAIEFIEIQIRENKIKDLEDKHYLLCHGIMNPRENNLENKEIAHAWVEHNNDVWFAGIYKGEKMWVCVDKREYYNESNILDVTCYNIKELYEFNTKFKTYGPWKTDYLNLCK